jgi:phospholipid/cholesterol/gamma-HCH transport system substrate-binding protein
MGKFTTEAKVGVFVLVGLALLAYMSFRVGGFDLGKKKGYEVYGVFDNASGLKKDVSIEIAGIEIGKVSRISLFEGRARVDMVIHSDVVLDVDCQATIRTKGVLGDKFVEITPGTPDLPDLAPGDRIIIAKTPTDIDQIITKVGEISNDIRKVTNSLNSVLGTEEGAAQMKEMLANFSEMSANLAQLTRDNTEQVKQMVENLTLFSADLRDMSGANKKNINAILASFAETSRKMNQTVTSLQKISDKIARGEGTIGALVHDDSTIRNLNSSLASLRDISEKLNDGQGTLGKLINESGTGEKIDEALEGINDYLAVNKEFKVWVDYRGDWLTEHEDMRSTLSIRFQPKQDKYYLIGVTSDPFGGYDRTERTTTAGGGQSTVIEEVRSQGDLKFSAQIAKRYYDFVVRGGLIESAGGFGMDYFAYDDAFRLSFEAFTGDFDHNPHLRAWAQYTFWDHFYVAAGYDDFISDQDRASPFIGIGLTFNDDDLKYLLTSAPIPTGK